MKIKNTTNITIRNKSRVDGRWFDGLGPGEVLETNDGRAIRMLLKYGCVILDKPKKQASKKKVAKKKKEAK